MSRRKKRANRGDLAAKAEAPCSPRDLRSLFVTSLRFGGFGRGLPIVDCGLRIADLGVPGASFKPWSGVPTFGLL
jgi:hypothetical protein